jgi:hypothetical protein
MGPLPSLSVISVTRLGDFSPIGQMFTMGSFFNYKSSPKIFVAFFPHRKSNGLILPKTGWAAYWATFYKPIWSPCPSFSKNF